MQPTGTFLVVWGSPAEVRRPALIAMSGRQDNMRAKHLLCATSPAPHQVFRHPLARFDIKEVRCFTDVLQPRLQQHCSSLAAERNELQEGPACVAEPS